MQILLLLHFLLQKYEDFLKMQNLETLFTEGLTFLFEFCPKSVTIAENTILMGKRPPKKGLLKKEDGAEKVPRSLTLEGYRDLQKN